MALGFLRGSPAPRDAPNAYLKSMPCIRFTCTKKGKHKTADFALHEKVNAHP